MKKVNRNIIIIILLSILVLFFALKDDFYGITNVLLNSNKLYILLLIFVILLGDLFKGCSFWVLIKKVKKDYKIRDAFMLILRSEFFYGITPFAIGGQPYQVYELKNREDISYADGVNIVFKDYYGYQLAFVTVSTTLLLVNYIFDIVELTKTVRDFIIVGYIVNLVAIVLLEYLKHSKMKHSKIIAKLIKLLHKIKVVKDEEKIVNRINNGIDRIRTQVQSRDPLTVLKSYLFSILKLIMLGLAGYISLKSTYINNVGILESLIIILCAMNIASFIPIPGGSGGMEYGFITLLAVYVVGSKLNAALLIWRFTGFYFLTLGGAIVMIIDEKFKQRRIKNEQINNG